MSENKHLANPCTTDSTPTSANQEDHVSMAAHAAMRLRRMNALFDPASGTFPDWIGKADTQGESEA